MKLNVPVLIVRSIRLTLAALSAVIISACSGPMTPDSTVPGTFPSLVPSSSSSQSVDKQRQDATFPLLNGSLRAVLTESGATVGTVAGEYSGSSLNPASGRATATLGVRVRRTTGVASNVTSIKADGSGAFVGEGEFTLSLALVTSKDGTITSKVRGTSAISCTAEGRIRVTMRGAGSAPRAGNIAVELQHEVGNTNCF